MANCFAHGQSTDGVVLRYGENIDNGYGGDVSTVITPYVVFPPDVTAAYANNRITCVNIGLKGEATNVYVYIKKSPYDTTPLYRQKVGTLKAGWNTVQLDTPFEITGDSISIGYKASFSKENPNGVGYSSESFPSGDYIYWNSKNNWYTTGGSLCIQAVVNGDNMPSDELSLRLLSKALDTYDGSSVSLTGVVRNMGTNPVKDYELSFRINEGEAQTTSFTKKLEVNDTDTFTVTLPSLSLGICVAEVSVSKVNGRPDAYAANNTDKATLTVRDKVFMNRVLVEKGTGTWCTWCPSGIVGMELMKEEYPDQFIPISIHMDDELEVSSYKPLLDKMPGVPHCFVNRKYEGHPFSDIKMLYALSLYDVCHVGFTMQAAFNADSTQVDVKASIIADTLLQAPNYRIAFAVVEDSVTGYKQANGFADGSNGDFYGWGNLPDPTDVVYDDVARGIYPSFDGNLCTPPTMTPNQPYEYTYAITLPDNIQRKENVRIIGMLIEPVAGYIINAFDATPSATIGLKEIAYAADLDVRAEGGNLIVTVSGQAESVHHVCLYSPTGALLKQDSFAGSEHRMSVADRHGLYFVCIRSGHGEVQTFKVML